jgi:hypothetical protein
MIKNSSYDEDCHLLKKENLPLKVILKINEFIFLNILKGSLICLNFISLFFTKSVKIIKKYKNVFEKINFVFLNILKGSLICIHFIFLFFTKSFIIIKKFTIENQNFIEKINFIFFIILKGNVISIKFVFFMFVKSLIIILKAINIIIKMIIHHLPAQYYLSAQTSSPINFSNVSSIISHPFNYKFNKYN